MESLGAKSPDIAAVIEKRGMPMLRTRHQLEETALSVVRAVGELKRISLYDEVEPLLDPGLGNVAWGVREAIHELTDHAISDAWPGAHSGRGSV